MARTQGKQIADRLRLVEVIDKLACSAEGKLTH